MSNIINKLNLKKLIYILLVFKLLGNSKFI